MSFRFESLLKLRKSQEYQAHKLVSSINSQLISNQASLQLLIDAENKHKQNFDQRLKNNLDIKTRNLFDKYFDSQKGKRLIKIAALEQIAHQLQSKQKELVSAIKKTKPLEILKQKELNNSRKIAMAIENNFNEEDLIFWRGQFS